MLTRAHAFTTANADRGSQIDIGSDTGGLLGLLVSSGVKKNQQTVLADITNNTDSQLTLTISLSDCAQGTLYAPDGSNGCSVTFSIAVDTTETVEINTGAAGGTVIPFTISGVSDSGGFSFSLQRETTAESGNTKGGVTVDKLQKFQAQQADNDWTIQTLEASSDQYDLDRIELSVREVASDTVVATRTITDVTGTTYSAKGNGNTPALQIQPDDNTYNVQNNVTYELTVTVFDTQNNFGKTTTQS